MRMLRQPDTRHKRLVRALALCMVVGPYLLLILWSLHNAVLQQRYSTPSNDIELDNSPQ